MNPAPTTLSPGKKPRVRVSVEEKRRSFRSFFSVLSRVSEASGIICALSILLSAGVLTYEVITRYVLKTPTIWEIEFSVFLLIMATFVGSAYGLKNGAHIHIDLITHLLPPRIQVRLSLLTSIVALLFCTLLAWMGWDMWWEATVKGWRSDSLWGPPLWVPYLFLPLGMTLLCLQYLVHISNLWSGLKSGWAGEISRTGIRRVP
jgi:TRAP-type C4-dicarboxylate transport system permease small subunit